LKLGGGDVAQGKPLDRNEIHQKLWEAKNRSGKVRIYQKEFAAYLELSATHLNRVIREFEKSGRLKKVGSTYRNIGVYVVRDPKEFLEKTGLS
jgi:hypothetical protein